MLVNGFLHAPVGLGAFHHAVPYADEFAGVQPSARNALRKETVRKDAGGEKLAETFHCAQAGRGEFAQQEHALQDAFQVPEQGIYGCLCLVPVPFRKEFPDDGAMFLLPVRQAEFVGLVASGGQAAHFDEPVRAAADGGAHDDGPVGLQGLFHYFDGLKHGFSVGNGAAAEFEYLHTLTG